MADFDQAIQINPDYTEAYTNRGLIWFNKGDYDKAMADYNEAIRLDPAYADAYIKRGAVWYYKGDYGSARADWEKALQIDPNNSQVRNNLEILRQEGY
jgi:tetratricopeptide (TPR) repeat protein